MMFIIWTVVLIFLLIFYTNKAASRFVRYGVRFIKPVPLLGNVCSQVFRLNHLSQDYMQLKNNFPEDRFVGRLELLRPLVIVFDPDLIKKIAVKDFNHFMDHRSLTDASVDPLFGRNLVSLRGLEWREMRSSLSPAFTKSKMKLMVPLMKETGEQMITALKEKFSKTGTEFLDIDVKELISRYANDVIASCVFGLKVDSYSIPDNTFYKMAKLTSHFGIKRVFVFLGYTTIPSFFKLTKLSFFNKETYQFYKDLLGNVMKYREIRNIIRHDMIHLLMEAKKGKLKNEYLLTKESDIGYATTEEVDIGKKTATKKEWTDDDLVAQAVTFLVAGYESVSTLMCFILHELSVNPDVQERLYQEIKRNHKQHNGHFDFDSISELKYLDMVVSETLRLWPPAIGLDRICTKDYNIGRPNKEATRDYIIRKGEGVVIPIWAIHHDAQNFPDPFKFDPERFSDENISKIKPFTYMPFGIGPRNCIGSRFALCEVKVMLYQILNQFKMFPCDKTQIPIELRTDTFNLQIKGGHRIRMGLREATQ